MERLTEKRHGENVIPLRMDGKHRWNVSHRSGSPDQFLSGEAADRLAAYEDTGREPEDIEAMNNELCMKCGRYKDAHLGACDGCRWRGEYEHYN